MVLLRPMQTFSLDLRMPATQRVDRILAQTISEGHVSGCPMDFGVMRRIVETVAITMLIAAVFGTGWLAAGQAFSVVLN
jgi:predicted secreted protein